MKAASGALAAHLAGTVTTIATCWKVTRTDAQVFGFTSHDADLTIDGVTYAAATGITRSAIDSKAGMQVDNLEAQGFLDSDAITNESLRAGDWDHAEVRVFEVNWADLSMGTLRQLRGWLGQVTVEGNAYKAELRGMFSALNASVSEPYSPGCTARLGDARCGKDLTDYTTTGTVFTVASNRAFATDLPAQTVRLTPSSTGAPPAGYFDAGLLTWTTGANTGRRIEVKSYAVGGDIELQLAMSEAIAIGDTFSVQSGCKKDRDTCFAKFGNVVNMRGYPDLPGTDHILRAGGQ